MKNDKIEIRSIQTELTSDADSRVISGLAIPVNSQSELLFGKNGVRFYEFISPDAVTQALIDENDVKIYLNHDESQGTFARSKYGQGSLSLSVTERGLEFEFEAPNTVFGNMIIEGIKRGDYDAISFAFVSNEDKEVISKNADGTYTRTINEILWLDEISILSELPAYPETEVDVRSLNEFKEKEIMALNEKLDAMLDEIEKNSKI